MKNRIQLSLLTAAICLSFSSAFAATYDVSSREDSGSNTLREAISLSNASAATTDTITFSVANSITVYSVLTITDNVIIEGAGTTLGAMGTYSGVTLVALEAGSANTVIKDLIMVSSETAILTGWANTSNITITGCIIGTDAADATDRGNLYCGIYFRSCPNSMIGGYTAAERNIISNNGRGIFLWGQSDSNTIVGNYMGTTVDGSAGLGSQNRAISINATVNNTLIGGTVAGARNVIAGNDMYGIYIMSTQSADNNRMVGNYFGINAAGTAAIPGGDHGIFLNASDGVWIEGNHFGNRITMISAVANAPQNNTVVKNYCGLLPSGSTVNLLYAIDIYGGALNAIGLPDGAGNSIVGADYGVMMRDGISVIAVGNSVNGNIFTSCTNSIYDISSSPGSAPTITYAAENIIVIGTANPFDYIEVFTTTTGNDTVRYVGSALTDSLGVWSFNPGTNCLNGEQVIATAKGGLNNTSVFSTAALVTNVAPTVTVTATLAGTMTFTPTRTPTVTPTASPTSTFTLTATESATATHSPTITPTPTISATVTSSPTSTMSPTINATATSSPTSIISPTNTATLTATSTNALGGVDLKGQKVLAYPNPASDEMNFLIHLEVAAEIKITIYNVAGEKIAIITERLLAGRGQVLTLNSRDIAPGFYIARVTQDNHVLETKKFAIVH